MPSWNKKQPPSSPTAAPTKASSARTTTAWPRSLGLPEIEIELPLAEIYERVKFSAELE